MNQVLNDIIFDTYIVVGVSAGPDSMCLLNLLEQKTNKIVVCHINHNIRKQSIIEENYLKDYCKEHNLIFESMTIKEYKENNFENEARKIRYKNYEEILKKYNEFPTAMQGLGYKEVVDYLNGNYTKEEMEEKIKMETRRYAKRQLTWFRKNKQTIWLEGTNEIQNNINIILEGIGIEKRK